DVPRILASLVGAADDRVLVVLRLERIAPNHLLDDSGEEIVRPHRRQAAGVAADRRAQPVIDIGVEHVSFLPRCKQQPHRLRIQFSSLPGLTRQSMDPRVKPAGDEGKGNASTSADHYPRLKLGNAAGPDKRYG